MTEQDLLRLKEALKRRALRLFPGDEEKQNAYVFGTINKIKKGRDR